MASVNHRLNAQKMGGSCSAGTALRQSRTSPASMSRMTDSISVHVGKKPYVRLNSIMYAMTCFFAESA